MYVLRLPSSSNKASNMFTLWLCAPHVAPIYYKPVYRAANVVSCYSSQRSNNVSNYIFLFKCPSAFYVQNQVEQLSHICCKLTDISRRWQVTFGEVMYNTVT